MAEEYNMHELTGLTEAKHVVCHNGIDVYHYTLVDVGQELTSGQPYMEVFNTENEALNFMPEIFRAHPHPL